MISESLTKGAARALIVILIFRNKKFSRDLRQFLRRCLRKSAAKLQDFAQHMLAALVRLGYDPAIDAALAAREAIPA